MQPHRRPRGLRIARLEGCQNRAVLIQRRGHPAINRQHQPPRPFHMDPSGFRHRRQLAITGKAADQLVHLAIQLIKAGEIAIRQQCHLHGDIATQRHQLLVSDDFGHPFDGLQLNRFPQKRAFADFGH